MTIRTIKINRILSVEGAMTKANEVMQKAGYIAFQILSVEKKDNIWVVKVTTLLAGAITLKIGINGEVISFGPE